MANRLEIHDLPQSGQIQAALLTDAGTRYAAPVPFRNPLEAGDRAEISWYFQEYFEAPYGPARERAQAVQNGFRNFGRLLFESVFGNGEARELLDTATAEGLSGYQLAIVSEREEFTSLPWELMNSPEAGYLASSFAATVRQTSPSPLPSFDSPLTDEQLNILVVSPYVSEGENGYGGGLAASLVPVLESLDVQVELDFLRPATFEALTDSLRQRQSRYHVLHLDGVLLDDEGRLLFEDADSPSRPVAASQLAEAMSSAGVPIVALSAGDRGSRQSAQSQAWQRVGLDFALAGVPVSLVLPNPLRGNNVSEGFLRRFYQSLAQGAEVGSALAAARSGLMDDPHRPTIAGPQVSWDWITPAVYQSRSYVPPVIYTEQPNPLVPANLQPQQEAEPESQFPAAGQYGLVGHHAELAQLERQLAQNSVVLLSGNTGAGKTELALGLARWTHKTGRRELPGGVFYSPFEVAHAASLERVIHEIGTAVMGLRFADLNADRQRGWVVEYLKEQPSLLILDGAENIAGFPPGSPGQLTEDEQAELAQFLSDVTGPGASKVLLTSRNTSEDWLSTPYSRIELKGLNPYERNDLAAAILTKAGVEADRVNEDVAGLLDDVQGHPLACQIALPLLKEAPASVIRGELERHRSELPDSAGEAGRDNFLTALMEYSWTKMSPPQPHPPALPVPVPAAGDDGHSDPHHSGIRVPGGHRRGTWLGRVPHPAPVRVGLRLSGTHFPQRLPDSSRLAPIPRYQAGPPAATRRH